MVEKLGRPRERGDRHPCGDRRNSNIDFRSEAQFQRMKEQARLLGLDPIITSQAGRLFCTGLITSRHMATIDYIAKVYARHARYVGKEMTRKLRSPTYQPSSNRSERLDESQEERLDALEARDEFEQLQRLIPSHPREIRDVIERLCVDDEMIPSAWIADLCVMLTMIEECRSGTRSSIKLTRGNLPLRRRTTKQLTRQEKFEAGEYAVPGKPKPTTPAEIAAAVADRARLVETIGGAQ